jgi:hypothetical protein
LRRSLRFIGVRGNHQSSFERGSKQHVEHYFARNFFYVVLRRSSRFIGVQGNHQSSFERGSKQHVEHYFARNFFYVVLRRSSRFIGVQGNHQSSFLKEEPYVLKCSYVQKHYVPCCFKFYTSSRVPPWGNMPHTLSTYSKDTLYYLSLTYHTLLSFLTCACLKILLLLTTTTFGQIYLYACLDWFHFESIGWMKLGFMLVSIDSILNPLDEWN